MPTLQIPRLIRRRRMPPLLAPVVLFTLAFPAFGQQEYVSRFDAFAGYAFLDSPHIGLFENGFATQFGFRPKTWYSVGFDYSITTGDTSITPNLLTTSLQEQLAASLAELAAAGLVPPGYQLAIPVHSRTQTFAFGPQLSYRHFKHATLFLRPVVGAIYEQATARPADPIAAAVVMQLGQLGLVSSSGKKTDTTWVLGAGGGFDLLFSRHVALRMQVDVVHYHPFNDLLKDGFWAVRFSTGPAFNFGRNIK
jgi:hypothetical protein